MEGSGASEGMKGNSENVFASLLPLLISKTDNIPCACNSILFSFSDFGDHPIVDRETEKKINESAKDKSLKFNWSKSIARSRRLPSRFLEGRTFFFSPSFEADSAAEIMRSVVIEAGGKCPKKINWKVIFSSIGDNNVHLIGVEQDRTLWQKEMQKHKIGKDDEFKVYKKELISMGVLRMKMDWESDLL